MKAKAQREDVQVRQGALNFINRTTMRGEAHTAFLAKVVQVYSDRMTCDIMTLDGASLRNIPILTKGGLVDGKVYGEVCLPAIDDYVIVSYASYGQRHKVIIGTILPYLVNEFTKDAVNSGSKQFTKLLLEADMPLGYRRIFKSGTTVQIEEDGGIIIETPSGTYFKISEADSEVVIEDQHGNNITMESGKVSINGNLEILQ